MAATPPSITGCCPCWIGLRASKRTSNASSPLSVVIAGGGFAGVEMSAAIAELSRHPAWALYACCVSISPGVVLVHSGEALLPEVCSRFSRLAVYASRQLAA